MWCVPVLGERLVDQLVLVALPGHVSSEAEEGGDVDSVHVLCVLHVAAQVELSQDAFPRLLLHTRRDDDDDDDDEDDDESTQQSLKLTCSGELKVMALGTS